MELAGLHERHVIAPGLAMSYLEAASVCLSRHHTPPCAIAVRSEWEDGEAGTYTTSWPAPSEVVRRSYAHKTEATETGAYCLALAASESHLGLFGVGRTGEGSGADWYISASADIRNPEDGELDLEDRFRLEITGIGDSESEAYARRRMKDKIEQAQAGNAYEPAIACVVAFPCKRVSFKRA